MKGARLYRAEDIEARNNHEIVLVSFKGALTVGHTEGSICYFHHFLNSRSLERIRERFSMKKRSGQLLVVENDSDNAWLNLVERLRTVYNKEANVFAFRFIGEHKWSGFIVEKPADANMTVFKGRRE